MNKDLSHKEMIMINILGILEDHKVLTKEEKDGLMMLFIETDLLEE